MEASHLTNEMGTLREVISDKSIYTGKHFLPSIWNWAKKLIKSSKLKAVDLRLVAKEGEQPV